jgi:hypothetical protein
MQRKNAASTCKLTKLQMNANLCLIIKILVPSTEDNDSNADGLKRCWEYLHSTQDSYRRL